MRYINVVQVSAGLMLLRSELTTLQIIEETPVALAFWQELSEQLKAVDWPAGYFFETPGLRRSTAMVRPFEAALIDAGRGGLSSTQNWRAFSEFLDTDECRAQGAVAFMNLSRDGYLVAPALDGDHRTDAVHLQRFMQTSTDAQALALWAKVRETWRKCLRDDIPLWMSTSGAGVPYLHVRFFNKPRYYVHAEFMEEAH